MPNGVDEKIWNKAKSSFFKTYKKEPKEDKDFAIVMTIYKNMGGKLESKELFNNINGNIKMENIKEVFLENKWIEAVSSKFSEELEEKTKKKKYTLTTKILPFGEKSRNGNIYNKESALKTMGMIKGLPLMHNHVTSGANVFSRGTWFEYWAEDDGLYGKANVFDTPANKEYIEWLSAQDNPKVSLQVSANAKQKKEESTGNYYVEAFITDWVEISSVNAPGFLNAGGKLETAMTESFSTEAKEIKDKNSNTSSKIKEPDFNKDDNDTDDDGKPGTKEPKDVDNEEDKKTETLKVGDKVHSPSGLSKIISIKNNKVIVRSSNPSGDFEYDIKDVQKESFDMFEKLLIVRNNL